MRLECVDVCIIGSGAGGAVVAHAAAKRGLKTLVLERGPYVRSSEMTASEAEMIPRLYKDGGLQLNTALDFFILQGSCVGGSTVVSNMVLMRTGNEVFDRWRRFGAELERADIDSAYDEIERLLDARRPLPAAASRSTRLFEQGALQIGAAPRTMLKALGDCQACGDCNIGCAFNTKKSALSTFIPWAERHGARVLADTEVHHVRTRRGSVQHVEATIGPRREHLRVRARVVVVSAGAIGSSALLLAPLVQRRWHARRGLRGTVWTPTTPIR
ncbi:MAG: FAD-dependent oxidoreductase [Polyangiaceae bacterium]